MSIHKSSNVDAPIIEEFPVALECKVLETRKSGSHVQLIGEIVNVNADESVLGEGGNIDIKKLSPITYDGTHNEYYSIGDKVGDAFSDGLKFKD